jgi:hypothetical protein
VLNAPPGASYKVSTNTKQHKGKHAGKQTIKPAKKNKQTRKEEAK